MPGELEFDMGAAVSDIGSSMGWNDTDGGDTIDTDPGTGEKLVSETDDSRGLPGDNPRGEVQDDLTPDPTIEDPAATAAKPPAAPGPNDAPNTWRPEAKAEWATLSPTIQAEIRKREEDAFRGIEGYKEAANFGNNFKAVLDPFMPILQQHNIDPVAQVQGLMHAHYTLAMGSPEAKVQLFQKLAQDYGVDLGQLGGEPTYVDPEVARLQREVQELKSTQTAEQNRRQQAVVAENRAKVDAFFSDEVKYPHAKTVANDMAALIKSGVCKDLPEAYEKALWANPVTRAAEQARITAELQAKSQKEAEERMAKVKRATAANVKTSAKSGSAAAPVGSLDDTIAETLKQIQSRG